MENQEFHTEVSELWVIHQMLFIMPISLSDSDTSAECSLSHVSAFP
jgi:hypothetical protein